MQNNILFLRIWGRNVLDKKSLSTPSAPFVFDSREFLMQEHKTYEDIII